MLNLVQIFRSISYSVFKTGVLLPLEENNEGHKTNKHTHTHTHTYTHNSRSQMLSMTVVLQDKGTR